jgi:hypothetical protein
MASLLLFLFLLMGMNSCANEEVNNTKHYQFTSVMIFLRSRIPSHGMESPSYLYYPMTHINKDKNHVDRWEVQKNENAKSDCIKMPHNMLSL